MSKKCICCNVYNCYHLYYKPVRCCCLRKSNYCPEYNKIPPCKSKYRWSNETRQKAYMMICVLLAHNAVKKGGEPYGAVIVDPEKNKIIARGKNRASSNPIWHGEMDALNNLEKTLKKKGLSVYKIAPKLELYTSAEPCPMCMSAFAWAGIGRVYYGSSIPFLVSQGRNQILIRAKDVIKSTPFQYIELVEGILKETTNKLYMA